MLRGYIHLQVRKNSYIWDIFFEAAFYLKKSEYKANLKYF